MLLHLSSGKSGREQCLRLLEVRSSSSTLLLATELNPPVTIKPKQYTITIEMCKDTQSIRESINAHFGAMWVGSRQFEKYVSSFLLENVQAVTFGF